jgi:hypothetical protein
VWLTVVDKRTNNDKYPNIVEDKRSATTAGRHACRCFACASRLLFRSGRQARATESGAPNPFVDPDELGRHVSEMKKDFKEALQAQEKQQ